MKRFAVLALAAAVACGGGSRTVPPPPPRPGAPPAPAPVVADTRIPYRLRSPLRYEISRYDSLFFLGAGSEAPQVTGRRAMVTVRSEGSRVHVVLDSLAGVLGPRLAPSALDSTRGAEWEIRMSDAGPTAAIRASRNTVLTGQIGAAVRLLFPQLPDNGVRRGDTWTDSTTYPIRVDAFESTETAASTSRAIPGAAPGSVRIEADERLTRAGKATQGGRVMGLSGAGARRMLIDFAADGWVSMVQAKDSLELVVTVPDNARTISVRWRSTVIARLRGTPPG